MEQSRLSDGKAEHDESFPVALDENFRRISAVEAIKLKDRFPKATFYCPKCCKIDPNNKTEVNPSNHKPPRFNRCKGKAHLESCQYKNAVRYLSVISQKIQVSIKGKEIQLSLMPYEGRGIVNKALGVRVENYTRIDNRKFMELVREILTDYEMKSFRKKYNAYKVGCKDGKSQSFRKLFRSIDNAKVNSYPYEEKLNIVVGKVKNVSRNGHYILLSMDSSHAPYELCLYFDCFFYHLDSLLQLEGKRIASMGYIQKLRDGFYVMEIVSMPHQVAILDDEPTHLSPSIQEKEISSFIKQLTARYHPIKAEDFYRSYYQQKLEQLQISINGEMDTLKAHIKKVEKEKLENKEQLMKVEKNLTKIRADLSENEHQINTINDILADISQKIGVLQFRINQLEKEKQRWWNWLRNIIDRRTTKMFTSEIELNRSKILEYKRQQEQETDRLDALKKHRIALKSQLLSDEKKYFSLREKIKALDNRFSDLDSEIKKLKQQLRRAIDKAEREKELKKTYTLRGDLYEFMVNSKWSVLIDIELAYQNLSLDCSIASYLIQKLESFYLPYEYNHNTNDAKSSYQRTIHSNRYQTIRKMADTIQIKLSEDIKKLCSLAIK